MNNLPFIPKGGFSPLVWRAIPYILVNNLALDWLKIPLLDIGSPGPGLLVVLLWFLGILLVLHPCTCIIHAVPPLLLDWFDSAVGVGGGFVFLKYEFPPLHTLMYFCTFYLLHYQQNMNIANIWFMGGLGLMVCKRFNTFTTIHSSKRGGGGCIISG